MPELPEVETTCRALRESNLVGRRIVSVEVRPNEREKLSELVAARPLLCQSIITEVARRGKYILLTAARRPATMPPLYSDNAEERQPPPAAAIELVIHLRMSGRLWLCPPTAATTNAAATTAMGAPPEMTGATGKTAASDTAAATAGTSVVGVAAIAGARSGYERAVWHLADGAELRFYDPRRFGTVCVYSSGGAMAHQMTATDAHATNNMADSGTPIASDAVAEAFAPAIMPMPARVARDAFLNEKCGIEPLSANFTAAWCVAALHKRKRALKALLLDQAVIAGLGNIYCDEALWWARLHPQRKGDQLTDSEAAQLCRTIRAVLIKGVRHGGTRLGNGVSNFRLPQRSNQNSEDLYAYGRTGHPCPRCAAPIERIIVAGRGTHVCPRCQR